MRSAQYQRIEYLLGQAELITLESPLLTPAGKQIQTDLRSLLIAVFAERFRAQQRERKNPADALTEAESFQEATSTYRALVAQLSVDCERLREFRKGKSDGVMVNIDELIAVKERTIAALNRSIEVAELEIRALAKSPR